MKNISSAYVIRKFSLTWVSVISLYSVCIFKQASNSSLATCASSWRVSQLKDFKPNVNSCPLRGYTKKYLKTFSTVWLFHDGGPYHYWNQSIDLQSKPMDYFQYDRDIRHESVKQCFVFIIYLLRQKIQCYFKCWRWNKYFFVSTLLRCMFCLNTILTDKPT